MENDRNFCHICDIRFFFLAKQNKKKLVYSIVLSQILTRFRKKYRIFWKMMEIFVISVIFDFFFKYRFHLKIRKKYYILIVSLVVMNLRKFHIQGWKNLYVQSSRVLVSLQSPKHTIFFRHLNHSWPYDEGKHLQICKVTVFCHFFFVTVSLKILNFLQIFRMLHTRFGNFLEYCPILLLI